MRIKRRIAKRTKKMRSSIVPSPASSGSGFKDRGGLLNRLSEPLPGLSSIAFEISRNRPVVKQRRCLRLMLMVQPILRFIFEASFRSRILAGAKAF